MGCRTRSAARSTPTVRASCPTPSPGSRTRCPTSSRSLSRAPRRCRSSAPASRRARSRTSTTSPTASSPRRATPPPSARTSTSRPPRSSRSPRSRRSAGKRPATTRPTSSSSTCRASRSTSSAAGRRSRRRSRCSAGRLKSTSATAFARPRSGCASRRGDVRVSAKRALITGITGQDGSYLADLLLAKGYEVHGMVRRASTEKFERIEHIRDRITLHQGDLLDHRSLVDTLRASQPDEIYNLAAMSFVAVSWIQPTLTAEFTGVGVTRLLGAVREVCPEARFYQASSSEMFGKVRETPQTESTPFYPRSPYGVAKAYGHFITVNYRESYDMALCAGILFNHESERRWLEFVTRKITWHAAAIKHGLRDELPLGNLHARRDWGYAKDYVEAMWLMLQQDTPEDFVIATGET